MEVPEPSQSKRSELPTLSSSLLEDVQQMCPDAWRRLVDVFSPIVYGWCRQNGLGRQDASDLSQDVLVAVAGHICNFERRKQEGSFRSWLATITRNRIRDFYRRQKSRPVAAVGGTEAMQRIQQTPDADLDHSITEASLNSAVPERVLELVESEFEPKTWQAFWLTTVESLAPSIVAERLEMQLPSVYQAKSRVLRKLRARMSELP